MYFIYLFVSFITHKVKLIEAFNLIRNEFFSYLQHN